jgi:hypothetical protein
MQICVRFSFADRGKGSIVKPLVLAWNQHLCWSNHSFCWFNSHSHPFSLVEPNIYLLVKPLGWLIPNFCGCTPFFCSTPISWVDPSAASSPGSLLDSHRERPRWCAPAPEPCPGQWPSSQGTGKKGKGRWFHYGTTRANNDKGTRCWRQWLPKWWFKSMMIQSHNVIIPMKTMDAK